VVSRAFLPQGARVFKGMPVMEVRPTRVARLRAEVAPPFVGFCRVGLPVQVVYPEQDVTFRGWVSRAEPTRSPRPPGALIEILLVETSNGSDAYTALEWLALTSPAQPDQAAPLAWNPPQPVRPGATEMAELFPLTPAGEVKASRPAGPAPADGQLSGSLELIGSPHPTRFAGSDPVAEKKLARLRNWRNSFVEGMKTTVFPETGLMLTYPRTGDISRAVERMATARVSHVPNMCAATLGEALGWCLGDAAMWAHRLPERGYRVREDGIARPGDILVWPFSYGPNRAQHVGLAVLQGGAIMMLSNSGGALGTKPLLGGYLAFYEPKPVAAAPKAAVASASRR
jgi:hypothetical protein